MVWTIEGIVYTITLIILIATRVTVAIGVTTPAGGGGGGDDAVCAIRVSR